jgi:hypothetical protein
MTSAHVSVDVLKQRIKSESSQITPEIDIVAHEDIPPFTELYMMYDQYGEPAIPLRWHAYDVGRDCDNKASSQPSYHYECLNSVDAQEPQMNMNRSKKGREDSFPCLGLLPSDSGCADVKREIKTSSSFISQFHNLPSSSPETYVLKYDYDQTSEMYRWRDLEYVYYRNRVCICVNKNLPRGSILPIVGLPISSNRLGNLMATSNVCDVWATINGYLHATIHYQPARVTVERYENPRYVRKNPNSVTNQSTHGQQANEQTKTILVGGKGRYIAPYLFASKRPNLKQINNNYILTRDIYAGEELSVACYMCRQNFPRCPSS